MKLLLTIICLCLGQLFVHAQVSNQGLTYPQVGKLCPDFTLRNIKYYRIKQATLRDFKGKWLVLDVWNKYCGACIASFPKINKMQNEFRDSVQFMMVGIEDSENEIEPMYQKFREKENLGMPCAFDSTLANRFDIYTSPYIIVINAEGIVKGITHLLDSGDLRALLSGKSPKLLKAYRMHEERNEQVQFNRNKPFLINGNGGNDNDYLFRSVLSAWTPDKNPQFVTTNIGVDSIKGMFQILGAPLIWLYEYAYYGQSSWGAHDTIRYAQYSNVPVIETKDSSLFSFSYKNGTNLYSYSLTIPAVGSSTARLQDAMKRDLETYFGFTAKIETRMCPYWKLVADKGAPERLRTHGGSESFQGIYKASFTAKNWPFHNLIDLIRNYNNGIFVDSTGIIENVDISMDCILTNLRDVIKALQANGLNLIQCEKPMKALVIYDEKHTIDALSRSN